MCYGADPAINCFGIRLVRICKALDGNFAPCLWRDVDGSAHAQPSSVKCGNSGIGLEHAGYQSTDVCRRRA